MTTEPPPYTDADLRHEAARQHATALEDPDFMGIGEQMEGADIASTVPADGGDGRQWDDLPEEQFDTAQRAIDDLINHAADVSEWAVNLGADDLVPTGHRIEIAGPDGAVAVRLHMAFDADMPTPLRDTVVADLVAAISPVIPLIPQT
ncbi:hypothetical protein [Streptomyces sp. CA-111067]|uniref:hypothetical protein n=1 Tax=Streptomyces sp. CA-111067 TaxID=3240046 RepID=UPI003D9955F0